MGKSKEPFAQKCVKGAPMWVVTFGDLMSLLLCFFVLLLSFSETDKQKYKQVAGSLEKAFGVQRAEPVMEIPKGMTMIAKDFDQAIIESRIEEEIGKEIKEILSENLSKQVAFESQEEEIIIRLMGESTFSSGSIEIREQLKPLLLKVALVLEKSSGDIIISGHTDDVPIHNSIIKSNLRLSIARAAAVAEYLLSNSKIDPHRIATMGFGEYRPIESNETAEGREKNRRVEIIMGKIPKPIQTKNNP